MDREPYKMAKKYSLLNYEWDYSMDSYDGRPRMTGKRKSAKRNADIIVSAKSEMDCLHQVSTLSDFFDADVLAGMSPPVSEATNDPVKRRTISPLYG